jgi:hypothetical protein
MNLTRIIRWNWLGLLCLWLTVGLAVGEDKSVGVSEYQVKAAFVFNFVKFTDWPASTFTNAKAPIVIGVVGENPFGHTLDDLVKGELVCGHPLVVKRFQTGEAFSACHVLFVSRPAKESLPALLAALRNKPVLTVSELDRFCEQGGMINLVLAGSGTVQPEINAAAARLAGVQISSKLLNLPTVRLVQTEP